MARERYPGERRGLSLFLEDLRQAAARVCGAESILAYAIRRALRSGDLDHLRHARMIFNHLPREQRRELSAACVRGTESRPAAHQLLERYSQRTPAPFISFESTGEAAPDRTASVSLTHELLPASPVRVMVSPGTLPRSAAGDLRRIAAMIERDRRLLSEHYWRRRDARIDEEEPPQAPKSSS